MKKGNKCKIFTEEQYSAHMTRELEDEINNWLSTEPLPEIINVSVSPPNVHNNLLTIIVFYTH